jgi:GTPase Era involved in 16S rRNA processing
VIVCANKIDLIDDEREAKTIEVLGQMLPGRKVCPLSAKTGENVDIVMDLATVELGITVSSVTS